MSDARDYRQADACRSPVREPDRYWLLSWTTYGSWLPGDVRGFVGEERGLDRMKRIENRPHTDYRSDIPSLSCAAMQAMTAQPSRQSRSTAEVVLAQFHETARFRGWRLLAVAVMARHVHLVVGVPGDPAPDAILRDLKAYASRALNARYGSPRRWWTQSGSKRKLRDRAAVLDAVAYVRDQPSPLIVWTYEMNPGERQA